MHRFISKRNGALTKESGSNLAAWQWKQIKGDGCHGPNYPRVQTLFLRLPEELAEAA
jgi:hypothetical protein